VPRISKDKVADFFASAVERIARAMVALEQQLSQYKGQIPDEKLKQVMVQQFEEELQEYQDSTLSKINCSEKDIEIAYIYYKDEDNVKQPSNQLKNMYRAITGEVTDEIPADLTEDLFAEALIEYYDTATNCMKSIMTETESSRVGQDQSVWINMVMKRFQIEHESACSSALEKYGLHTEMISSALNKFKGSSKVISTFAQCQNKQQNEFASLGLV